MGRKRFRWTWSAALLLIAAVSIAVPAVAGAAKKKPPKPGKKVVGAFYTETNGAPNKLLVFARFADGTLQQRPGRSTGGLGGHQGQPINVNAPPPVCTGNGSGCPALDSQSAVVLTPNGNLIFAVNAGSNTVSSFKVTKQGPVLVDQVGSGGKFPNSLTVHGNVLYVLNSNSLNIEGMRFNSNGKLTPIASQPLNPNGTAPGSPRNIHFDNAGKWLVVTKLVNPANMTPTATDNTLDVFHVNSAGVAGPAVSSNSVDLAPFSVGFDGGDHVLVTTVGNPFAFKPGVLASYSIGSDGKLHHIASTTTGGYAPCWDVETSNHLYGYIVNADILGPGAPSVATLRLFGNGQMTFLGHTPRIGDEPLETDLALSHDGKFLYVSAPIADRAYRTVQISHIDVYKIGKNHKPTLIQQTPYTLPQGLTGAAAK